MRPPIVSLGRAPIFPRAPVFKWQRVNADTEQAMDYTKWTTDELVRLQGMVSAEDVPQEERDAVARELRRRQSAPVPAPTLSEADTPPDQVAVLTEWPEVETPQPETKSRRVGVIFGSVLGIALFAIVITVVAQHSYRSAQGSPSVPPAPATAPTTDSGAGPLDDPAMQAYANCARDGLQYFANGNKVPSLSDGGILLQGSLDAYGYSQDTPEGDGCTQGWADAIRKNGGVGG
jgi:hypothetical protein